MSKHIHKSTESQDCDGRYSSERVLNYAVDKDIEWYVALGFEVSENSNVTKCDLDDEGLWSAEIHTPTEEGYRWCYLRECEDECDPNENSFRDFRAEEMGY